MNLSLYRFELRTNQYTNSGKTLELSDVLAASTNVPTNFRFPVQRDE
jgi:hypothetical protein